LEPLDPLTAGPLAVRQPGPQPLTVGHVAGAGRCYPGDTVTLYTQVEARAQMLGFTLQVSVPPGLTTGDYQASPNHGAAEPELVITLEAATCCGG